MKKKMLWIVGGVVAVVAIVIGVILVIRHVNSKNAVPMDRGMIEGNVNIRGDVSANGVTELIAIVENEQEAQELAELYEINLKKVNEGVAVFETEEDPLSVIRKGEANGWKKLDINTVHYINFSATN